MYVSHIINVQTISHVNVNYSLVSILYSNTTSLVILLSMKNDEMLQNIKDSYICTDENNSI